MVVWEYLITFSNEVDIFWRRPVNATSLLFLLTRWTMLGSVVTSIAPNTEST